MNQIRNYYIPSKGIDEIAKIAESEFISRDVRAKKQNTRLNGLSSLQNNEAMMKILNTEEGLLWFLKINIEKRPNLFLYVAGARSNQPIDSNNKSKNEFTSEESFFAKLVRVAREEYEAKRLTNPALDLGTIMCHYSKAIETAKSVKLTPIMVISGGAEWVTALTVKALKRLMKLKTSRVKLIHNYKVEVNKHYSISNQKTKLGKEVRQKVYDQVELEHHQVNILKRDDPEFDPFMAKLPPNFFQCVLKNVTTSPKEKEEINTMIDTITFEFFGVDRDKDEKALPSLRKRMFNWVSKFSMRETAKESLKGFSDQMDDTVEYDVESVPSKDISSKSRTKKEEKEAAKAEAAKEIFLANIQEILEKDDFHQSQLKKGMSTFFGFEKDKNGVVKTQFSNLLYGNDTYFDLSNFGPLYATFTTKGLEFKPAMKAKPDNTYENVLTKKGKTQ